MSRLWGIIQTHLDEYGVREAAFARRMGTTPQTLNSWKNRGLRKLPERWLLEAVARETRTPYRDVLAAVIADIGYGDEPNDTPPMSQAGGRPAIGSSDTGSGPGGRGGGAAQAGPASLEGSEPRRGGIQRGSLPRRRPTRGRPRPQDTQDGTTDISD